MDALVDAATFEGMKELLEDEFPAFLDMFFCESQEALGKIKAGLENQEVDVIRAAAHNLKSSSGYIGAVQLSGLARDIETQAISGSTHNIGDMFNESQNVFEELKTHLK